MNLLERNKSIGSVSFRTTKPNKVAEESAIFIGENSFSLKTRLPSLSKSLSSLPSSTGSPTFLMITPPKQKLRDILSARTPKKKLQRIPRLWGRESYSSLQVENESEAAEQEEKSWEFHLAEMLEKTSLKIHNNNDWTESNGTLETCEETEVSDDSGRGQQSVSSLSLSSSPETKHCKLQLTPKSPSYQKRREIQDKQNQLVPPSKQMTTKFTVNMDKGGIAWVHSSSTAAPHLELNIVPVKKRHIISDSSTSNNAPTPRKRRGRRAISKHTMRSY